MGPEGLCVALVGYWLAGSMLGVGFEIVGVPHPRFGGWCGVFGPLVMAGWDLALPDCCRWVWSCVGLGAFFGGVGLGDCGGVG